MLTLAVVAAVLAACTSPRHVRRSGVAGPSPYHDVRPSLIEVEDVEGAVGRAAQAALAMGMTLTEVSKENGLLRVRGRSLDPMATIALKRDLADRAEDARMAWTFKRMAGGRPDSAELDQLEESEPTAAVFRVVSITAMVGGRTATVDASMLFCTRRAPGVMEECEGPTMRLVDREFSALQAIEAALKGGPQGELRLLFSPESR